jgi:hypothetical protein
MVNFGLNPASILGIFLAVAGAGLYFMRSVRPELSRDHDIFFAAVGLLCGLILFSQGWRLDPILQFSQFLLTSSAIFFAVETIRLRGVTTEQAKRGAPIVDEERRVSRTRVYTEAELDRLEPYEEEGDYESNRRLRGYAEPRERRESGYGAEEPRSGSRRPSSRYEGKESPSPRQRRSRPASDYSDYQQQDVWQDTSETPDTREGKPASRRPRRPRPEATETSSRPPRRRPPERAAGTPATTGGDYVDYQPIDSSEAETGGWESKSPEEGNPNRGRNEGSPTQFDY